MGSIDRRASAGLLLCLCVAGAVRLTGLSEGPLTAAEEAALASSPLYAAGLAAWGSAFGHSELATRWASAGAGTLAAALAALVGMRLAGARVGAWAGALVALSPIHALASRTAGPEAPLVLLLLTALWLVVGLDSEAGARRAAGAGIALGMLAVSGVAAFGCVALVMLAWLAWAPDRRVNAALVAVAGVAIATALSRLGLARSPLDFGEIPAWIPDATASKVVRCAGASFTRVLGLEYHLLVPQARHVLPLTVLFVALAAWGALRLPARMRTWLLAGAVLPFVLGAGLALAIGRVLPLQAIRLLAALPFVALLMASGLASLRGRLGWAAGTAVLGTLAAFLALALAR